MRERREEEIERKFAICIRFHAIGFELFAMFFCQSYSFEKCNLLKTTDLKRQETQQSFPRFRNNDIRKLLGAGNEQVMSSFHFISCFIKQCECS